MIVTTTKGDMDDSLLEMREGSVDASLGGYTFCTIVFPRRAFCDYHELTAPHGLAM
jgi:hypothetical protein